MKGLRCTWAKAGKPTMSEEALVWATVERHPATNLERQGAGRLSTLESAQWDQALQKGMQPPTRSREELVHKCPDHTLLLPPHLLLVPPIGWAQPECGG